MISSMALRVVQDPGVGCSQDGHGEESCGRASPATVTSCWILAHSFVLIPSHRPPALDAIQTTGIFQKQNIGEYCFSKHGHWMAGRGTINNPVAGVLGYSGAGNWSVTRRSCRQVGFLRKTSFFFRKRGRQFFKTVGCKSCYL